MNYDYTAVKLPDGRFEDGKDSPLLHWLDVAVGHRGDDYTILHVRGQATVNRNVRGGSVGVYFAGSTVVRDGRDYPQHDIIVLGEPDLVEQANAINLIVVLALDAHWGGLATEVERICG